MNPSNRYMCQMQWVSSVCSQSTLAARKTSMDKFVTQVNTQVRDLSQF